MNLSRQMSNSRTWLNAEIPSEIGRAEDGVKEAIVNSKESVVKNVKIVGNSVSNHVEKGTTVVRHRAKQFRNKFEEIRTNVEDKIWVGRLLKYSELPALESEIEKVKVAIFSADNSPLKWKKVKLIWLIS